jgi:hypothetical protein
VSGNRGSEERRISLGEAASGAITRLCCGDGQEGGFVDAPHESGLTFPVFVAVLDDTQRINPEKRNVQPTANLDGILEGLRETFPVNRDEVIFECLLCRQGRMGSFTPAVA